ncbi:exported hypothetical protein [Gammaproteobacteria bacterium]
MQKNLVIAGFLSIAWMSWAKSTVESSMGVVFFDLNSAQCVQKCRSQLETWIQLQNASKEQKIIEVSGHTDAAGNAQFNESLSLRRAKTVFEYLISKGIEPSRLHLSYYGARQLKDQKYPKSATNRRVEIHFLDQTIISTLNSKTFEELNVQAVQLYRQGKYVEAEPLFQRALTFREKTLDPADPGLWLPLNNLGMVYKAQERYSDAEKLFRRALAIREKSLGQENPELATSLNNLGSLFQNQGKHAEAIPLYQRALVLLEKTPNTLSFGITLNNLGSIYQDQGEYAKAEPILERAFFTFEQIPNVPPADMASVLNNLGSIYQMQGQYGRAEPLLQRALILREQTLGREHPAVGRILQNLGSLYQSQGQLKEAALLLERALALRQKVFEKNPTEVAQSLNALGFVYQLQERYAAAEKLHLHALSILQKQELQQANIGRTLHALGNLYQELHQYKKAEKFFSRSSQALEQSLGAHHIDLGNVFDHLGKLYVKQKQYTKAEPILKNALSIQKQVLGNDSLELVNTLSHLGELYKQTNRNSEGLDIIREASNILRHRLLSEDLHSTGDNRIRKSIFSLHLHFLANRLKEDPSLRLALTAESIEVAQLQQGKSENVAIFQRAAQHTTQSSPSLEELMRQRQDILLDWRKADSAWVTMASKSSQLTESEQATRTQISTFGQRLHALDQKIRSEFPTYFEITRPDPVTLDQLQQWIRPEEVILLFVLGSEDKPSYVWQIRSSDTTFRVLPFSQNKLRPRIHLFRSAIDHQSSEQFPVEEAYSLYQDLMGPEMTGVNGVKTVLIVADGVLEQFPFSALVTEAPTSGAPHWLAQRWSTIFLPSLGSLRVLRSVAT